MYFKKKKESSNLPSERIALATNVATGIWSGTERGKDVFRFSLDRIDQEGNVFRTFRPEHLPQLPVAILELAKAFSRSDRLDMVVRDELSRMASSLEAAFPAPTVLAPGVSAPVKEPSVARIF